MSSFGDSGSFRSGGPGRRYGRAPGRGPADSGGRGRPRGTPQTNFRPAAQPNRSEASPRRAQCPPEFKAVLKDALDFLAGLIRVMGLPARLSFGGMEPARDGMQLTLDIRALRRTAGAAQQQYDRSEDHDDQLAILIGKHGATLDAISAITNAAMHDDTRDVFFSVDVEGYRARRAATLRSIAQRCAERALREGVAIELEPMPAADRRIVHMTLANQRGLATESTGMGNGRRVVIMPRRNSFRDEYAD